MKIAFCRKRTRRDGMAVIALIGLMAIILIFVAANVRTVHLLRSDLRTIERHQTNYWAAARLMTSPSALTNTTSVLPAEQPLRQKP